eukprot:6882153-Pyramimonas_sp.AAC.1
MATTAIRIRSMRWRRRRRNLKAVSKLLENLSWCAVGPSWGCLGFLWGILGPYWPDVRRLGDFVAPFCAVEGLSLRPSRGPL